MYLGNRQSAIWEDRLDRWVLYLRAHRPHRCFSRVVVDAGKLDAPYPFTPLPGKNYDTLGAFGLTNELPAVMDRDERPPPGAQPYQMNAWKYPQGEGRSPSVSAGSWAGECTEFNISRPANAVT